MAFFDGIYIYIVMTFKTHQTDPNGYTVSHATNENDVLLFGLPTTFMSSCWVIDFDFSFIPS